MTACWACGASGIGPAVWLAPLPFSECAACGFCQRSDVDAAALQDEYAGGAYESERSETYAGEGLDARRRDARVRLKLVARHRASAGRLLDVGAAAGAFVAEASAQGYVAKGVEPSPETARYGREHLGADIVTGMVEDVDLGPHPFDVVTLWHVLEHIREPVGVLGRLRDRLADGGVLALEVPNAASAIARALGPAWPALEPDVHVGQFGPRSLAAMLQRAGFEVVYVGTVSIAVYYNVAGRFAPAQLVHHLRWARRVGTLRNTHPAGHELLRAVARPRQG